jgi:hypothetical protein
MYVEDIIIFKNNLNDFYQHLSMIHSFFLTENIILRSFLHRRHPNEHRLFRHFI